MNLHKVSWWLLIIGGLDWLLVGLFQWDVFGLLGVGMASGLARLVYVLVGLSAVYQLYEKRK
jgi:uncharacterized membrane protein YuzA (DUF378 family)